MAAGSAARISAEPDATVQLDRVVRLDERVEAVPVRLGHQRADGLVVEVAEQEQHGVRAGLLRRAEIVGRREEPLREERDVARGAGRAEVVPRAAEALVAAGLVDDLPDGIGAAARAVDSGDAGATLERIVTFSKTVPA